MVCTILIQRRTESQVVSACMSSQGGMFPGAALVGVEYGERSLMGCCRSNRTSAS